MRWGVIFDIPQKEEILKELENEAADPNFWNKTERATEVLKKKADISSQLEKIKKLTGSLSDAETLLDLAKEENENSLLQECEHTLNAAQDSLRKFELMRMLTGLHDTKSAIIEVNPGAGGTEAQDWGDMLLRMYLRWAEKKGFTAEILNYQPGETAGLKNATVFIQGENAYGFLRSEKGVHRLVRISPFDSNARRHTSFASVSVMPEVDDDIKIEIRDEDLRIDTYRSSGAGGQHVNKTDSAVRLTHLPTGLVVACQNERSQHKNKATAMKLLKAKIYDLELEKKEAELAKIAGERLKIDFGSQIRSYVMQPYQLVKDLRTEVETGNVHAVMDGDLDAFIEGYLLSEDFNRPTV